MSLETFARDAISSLISIVQEEKSAFCSTLAAELFLARESIKFRYDEKNEKSEARLRALLHNLERLCKGPQRLVSKTNMAPQRSNITFPQLKKMIKDQKSASANIRSFATSNGVAVSGQRKELLQMLRKFNKATTEISRSDSSQSQGQRNTVLPVGNDRHMAILTLYDALSAHCFCHQTRVHVKIRLREERMKQFQAPAFNVLFLAHPHQDEEHMASFWQDTRIDVVFKDASPCSKQVCLADPIKHGELCGIISSHRKLQLSFLLSDQNLHFDDWCEGEKSWIANLSSISLTTMLMKHKLNQRGRYLLSFFLATAVCMYYGSGWMTHPWTKENIHFMFERRGNISGIFLNEPFVSAHFYPSSATNHAPYSLSFSEIHSLGIIILEIELGSTIEEEMKAYPECFAPDGSQIIDANLYTAMRLYDDSYRMEDTHHLLYEVIGTCLRPTVLKPYATEMTGLRNAIHKHIVSPLQELITGSYVEADPEKVSVSRPTIELKTSSTDSTAVFSSSPILRNLLARENSTFPQQPSLLDNSWRHEPPRRSNEALSRPNSSNLETEPDNYAHSLYYTVGWICALPIEMAACTAMLDNEHPLPPTRSGDSNSYRLGNIGDHNVVIACLPSGVYGTTSAATVAMDMIHSFPSIQHRFMVGIAGGIPSKKNDIRLGDIVVCNPTGTISGIFQHDMSKKLQGSRSMSTGALNKPPHTLLTAIAKLQSQHILGHSMVSSYLSSMETNLGEGWSTFKPPHRTADRLYKSDSLHVESNEDTCSKCVASGELTRPSRATDHPRIYYGLIASGNSLVRDSCMRDRLSEQGFLAFEMESVGLMDRFPCLVIRGICDYSDSHKNKEWQGYAAATAAAYAKEVLYVIPAS